MTVASVPQRGLALVADHIVPAAPIQATDWSGFASAYNLLDGMGSALIPMCAPYIASGAGSTTSLKFTAWPRYQCTHRLWVWSAAVDSGTTTGTFTDPNGSAYGFATTADQRLFSAVETVAARGSAEVSLTVSIRLTAAGFIYAIGCYELPRASMVVGGSDLGQDVDVARAGWPICDDYAGEGVGYIAREMDALRDGCRRTGLFAIAPFATTTSATFVSVMQSQPFALGRSLYNGQTQAVMQLAVNARVDAGTVGEVRITMASGASVVVPAASVRTQLPIDCEDMASGDGRRSSRDDSCTFEIRRVSGGGNVYLDTANGGEGTAASIAIAAPLVGRRSPPFGKGPMPRFMGGKKRA